MILECQICIQPTSVYAVMFYTYRILECQIYMQPTSVYTVMFYTDMILECQICTVMMYAEDQPLDVLSKYQIIVEPS
jgi:hypothetical protein